jgi:DNA-binding NarL/FixJ family response regulator
MRTALPDIRVLVADDHAVIRAGLRALLEAEADVRVVAEADTGSKAVEQARSLQPDVALIDVGMPGVNGIEATRSIRRQVPQTHVLALSMYADPHYVGHMLRAGARGYLLKECASEELITAVREVARGGMYVSPQLTDLAVQVMLENVGCDFLLNDLTARERQVLQLIAEGHTTRGIASQLSVSTRTIETHRRHMMRKLHVDTVAGLTRIAVREGLTTV